MTDKNTSFSKRGMSLVGVLVGMALMGLLAIGISQLLSTAFKGQRTIASRTDLDMIKQSIRAYLDCEGTFASAQPSPIDPINPASGECDSTSAEGGQQDPWLRLRRRSSSGTVQWLTEELTNDEYAVMGKWFVRASCSKSEQTLVIRAGQIKDGVIDFNLPNSLIFGQGPTALPICSTTMGDVGNRCAAGQVAVGFDPGTGTPICESPPAIQTRVSWCAMYQTSPKFASCTATCNSDEVVTGGGIAWSAIFSDNGRYSHPKSNGWFCGILIDSCSTGTFANGCKGRCYALCAER